jgi:hypothetical protein
VLRLKEAIVSLSVIRGGADWLGFFRIQLHYIYKMRRMVES